MSEQKNREQRDMENSRRRTPPRRGGHSCLVSIMYIAFVLGVSMFLASVAIMCANDVFAFVKADRTAVIEVTEDDDAKSIGEMLEEAGVVNMGACSHYTQKFQNQKSPSRQVNTN